LPPTRARRSGLDPRVSAEEPQAPRRFGPFHFSPLLTGMFFFSPLGSQIRWSIDLFFHLIWGPLYPRCWLCVRRWTFCLWQRIYEPCFVFFSSVGQFMSSLLGYVFLFSLGMLVPGVFISPLPFIVNRPTEWRRLAIDVLCYRYGGVRFEDKGRWEILIHGYSRCLVGWMDVMSHFSVC